MLKVSEKVVSPRPSLIAGQKVRRKYRLAQQQRKIRKREYKKLKAIVPAIAKKDNVHKITVVEEAIKYIDELHLALAKRMHMLQGLAPGLLPAPALQMLAPSFQFPLNLGPSRQVPTKPTMPSMFVVPQKPTNNSQHRKRS